jgi:hypothetical protein
MRTRDMPPDDIPVPFNMLHVEHVDNVDAACLALSSKGLSGR